MTWRRFNSVALCTAVALLLGGTAASEAKAESCSAPEVYGSYALRACIESAPGGAQGYAYVSLAAGHSACVIRGRYAGTDGSVGDLFTWACPSGAVTHYRVDLPGVVWGFAWYYSAFSIQRTYDGNIAPSAQSPPIPV
jgi:hypothetical protein